MKMDRSAASAASESGGGCRKRGSGRITPGVEGIVLAASLFLAFLPPADAPAQNFRIIDQRLDGSRFGYTVLHVWGTHREMGFGFGAALAPDIVTGVEQVRSEAGDYYDVARAAASAMDWSRAGMEEEMAGVVDGVLSVLPDADVDVADVEILNAMSDLPYACRSHSCWGGYVTPPVRTLSTRRLDYSAPVEAAYHHVLCAWEPDGGLPWVNFGWAGIVTAITSVNVYGTLVSLHDSGDAHLGAGVTARSAAGRHILTEVGELALEDQLSWASDQLAQMDVATTTFINYYVPEGHGGVFYCDGGACSVGWAPEPDYFDGEVLITTNSMSDGHGTPSGGDFMAAYYEDPAPKDIRSHFELMGSTGFHLMTVAYRGPGDMTLWADAELPSGRTSRIELEWSDLFAGNIHGDDDGRDENSEDAAVFPDSGPDAAADASDEGEVKDEGGCGCRLVS